MNMIGTKKGLTCLFAFVMASITIDSIEPTLAKNYALIIGINRYPSLPADKQLKTADNDANALAATLKGFGYQTELLTDSAPNTTVDKHSVERKLGEFLGQITAGDTVVVAYSGHGAEISGENFIIPGDVRTPAAMSGPDDFKADAISVPELMDKFAAKSPAVVIWILDACREYPFSGPSRAFGKTGGMGAVLDAPLGQFVFYASDKNGLSYDQRPTEKTAKNSIFNRHFTQDLEQSPHQSTVSLIKQLQPEVRKDAAPLLQRPTYYDGIEGYWCFEKCSSSNTVVSAVSSVLGVQDALVDHPSALWSCFNSSGFSTCSMKPSVNIADATNSIPKRGGTLAFLYLGRASILDGCRTLKHPPAGGCDVLKQVAANGKIAGGGTLVLKAKARLFDAVPIQGLGTANTAFAKAANAGSVVSISSVVKLTYEGDTYYWGAVSSLAKDQNSGGDAVVAHPVDIPSLHFP
jgi:hypothetical protein